MILSDLYSKVTAVTSGDPWVSDFIEKVQTFSLFRRVVVWNGRGVVTDVGDVGEGTDICYA